LLIRYVLHPVSYLAVLLFLNGDMAHGSGSCRPMPVLLSRLKLNHRRNTSNKGGLDLSRTGLSEGSESEERLPPYCATAPGVR